MSFDLPAGAVLRPVANGMREGLNLDNDPTEFYYTAYQHPHGPSWFGGTRRSGGRRPVYGGWIHYITSSVNILVIPAKSDEEVAAINYDMWMNLVRLEYQFWEDYANEKRRLTAAWAQDAHPLVNNPDLLPAAPRSIHIAAIKYAHRQVAIRAGKEDQLPANYDQQEFEEDEEDPDMWNDE